MGENVADLVAGCLVSRRQAVADNERQGGGQFGGAVVGRKDEGAANGEAWQLQEAEAACEADAIAAAKAVAYRNELRHRLEIQASFTPPGFCAYSGAGIYRHHYSDSLWLKPSSNLHHCFGKLGYHQHSR